MKKPAIYLYALLTTLLALTGCATEDVPGPTGSAESSPVVFDVEFATRAGENVKDSPLYDYFIDGRSVIMISQRSNNMSINFNPYTETTENDQTVTVPNKNLYKYVYYTNPSADWEAGFNFQPLNNSSALDWDLIASNGPLNSDYALGALFYPVDYEVFNAVQSDQSSYDDLLRSNVLGAWHRTNELKSRLRFRFFHLMSAARVTILIPDWDPADNSGFGENAAQSAYMLKMKREFSIDWPIQNTEESPVPQILSDAEPTDIKMYLESVSNEVETVNLSSINSSFPDQEERIRRATFVILFPPQQPTTEGPAMRFFLNTMGGAEKRYVWYSNDFSESFYRNTIINLILYLPRTENNAILIKSYIVPWTEAESEFNVYPDDE